MRACGAVAAQVHPRILEPAPGFVERVNAHLLLVYTGKTRLARGLLQSVLRRWAARLPEIVATTDALVATAHHAALAVEAGAAAARHSVCARRYLTLPARVLFEQAT